MHSGRHLTQPSCVDQASMPSVQEQRHQDSLSIGSYSSKEDIRKRHFLNNFVRPQNPAVPQSTFHDSVTSPSPPMKDLFAESDSDDASNPHDYYGLQDDGDPSFLIRLLFRSKLNRLLVRSIVAYIRPVSRNVAPLPHRAQIPVILTIDLLVLQPKRSGRLIKY